MKAWYRLPLLISLLILICGCSSNETEEIQMISLNDIETIYINHGSTTVYVSSFEEQDLQTSLISNDNGPGIEFDKNKSELKISLKSDIRRLFNVGDMPELYVHIPSGYDGEIILNGSSGQVNIGDVDAANLKVKGKSGNVTMDLVEINNNINVSVTSGNVILNLRTTNTDAEWLLQSSSGKRSVAFTLDDHKLTNQKTTGQTGNGTFLVHIKTSSGRIEVG
ncbi:DUF4097 domain-containing protein [Neobacillus mesonae]|nr:DUF4097 domain-containing protein [Neobacillus mesonae]